MNYAEHGSSAPQIAGGDGFIGYQEAPEALAGQENDAPIEFDKPDPPPPAATSPGRLGMKITTFWLLVGLITFLIIGGAVGGAVGGTIGARKHIDAVQAANNAQPSASSDQSASSISSGLSGSSTTASGPASSSAASASPAQFTPSTDCPNSNGTTYTSLFAQGKDGTPAPGAGLTFQKYCNLGFPGGMIKLAEAWVYSFDDCIELCASINFWAGNSSCQGANYWLAGTKPGNCWAYKGHAEYVGPWLLYTGDPNSNVAPLIPPLS